jgi:AraC-like DNA-binding protein
MQEDTYYIEFRAINLNRSIKKLSNRLNYSRTLLLKLFIQDTTSQHPITIAESL